MKTRTNRIRLNESQLNRIIKESVKKVLNEHLSDLSPMGGHKISPKQALAQYLRISPKKIYNNGFEESRYYCETSPKTDNRESSWCVYNSYDDAEKDVRNWASSYCSSAADDEYWIRAGYEKTNNGDFDWDTIADDIIDSEGIEWFLAGYDGTSTELPDGYVGFRLD